MGIEWSTDRKSEITISNRYPIKFSSSTEEGTTSKQDVCSSGLLEDAEWMKKLRDMDEAHSEKHGLTTESFFKLIEGIEKKIKVTESQCCSASATEVLECLKNNEKCTIKCQGILDNFMNCIDEHYLESSHKSNQ